MANELVAVDLSHWNPTPDWAKPRTPRPDDASPWTPRPLVLWPRTPWPSVDEPHTPRLEESWSASPKTPVLGFAAGVPSTPLYPWIPVEWPRERPIDAGLSVACVSA